MLATQIESHGQLNDYTADYRGIQWCYDKSGCERLKQTSSQIPGDLTYCKELMDLSAAFDTVDYNMYEMVKNRATHIFWSLYTIEPCRK